MVSLKFCCLVHIKLILNFELKTTTFVNAIGEEKKNQRFSLENHQEIMSFNNQGGLVTYGLIAKRGL